MTVPLQSEMDAIFRAIAERCITPAGKIRALATPLYTERTAIEQELDLGREASLLLEQGEPLPIRESVDLTTIRQRLVARAPLARTELRDMQRMLAQGRTLRRFFTLRPERTRMLAQHLSTDTSLDALEDSLREVFDSEGAFRDDASADLKTLREAARMTRARILKRLDEIMAKYAHTLQENFITEREGRFVLPIRSDSHERFAGILHASSASGHTLFLEPQAIVQLGNELKVQEADVEREEEAICARLSAALYAQHEAVFSAEAKLAHADQVAAVARLKVDLDLAFVKPAPAPVLEVQKARHPLLLLRGLTVVPSDIGLRGGVALVVSGPNAGGKTVALKTAALLALMVRAGLPVPCSAASTIGLFTDVFLEVGDGQTLLHDLSTFSSHIKAVASIVEKAHPTALVLLDELAGGTDPHEGEALAIAIVETLTARGAAVMLTTHYEALKARAFTHPAFRNASMGFDAATWAPTFHLLLDAPGPSSALSVAERFGMPEEVLARAKAILPEQSVATDALLRGLHAQKVSLAEAHDTLQREQEAARTLQATLERERHVLAERGERLATKEVEALFRKAEAMRAEIEALSTKLRMTEPASVRSLEREADALVRTMKIERSEASHPALTAVPAKGTTVFIRSMEKRGEVLEAVSATSARIQVGSMKMVVPLKDLALTRESAAPQASAVCDVRGMRADDAVSRTTAQLERAVSSGARIFFVQHGTGNAVVRDRIHHALRASPYASSFRKAELHEGGDAVTVVHLT